MKKAQENQRDDNDDMQEELEKVDREMKDERGRGSGSEASPVRKKRRGGGGSKGRGRGRGRKNEKENIKDSSGGETGQASASDAKRSLDQAFEEVEDKDDKTVLKRRKVAGRRPAAKPKTIEEEPEHTKGKPEEKPEEKDEKKERGRERER